MQEVAKQQIISNQNAFSFLTEGTKELDFRIANRVGHKKVYAFNYLIPKPSDTIRNAINKNNQLDLLNDIQEKFGAYGQKIISKFRSTNSEKNCCFSSTRKNWTTS